MWRVSGRSFFRQVLFSGSTRTPAGKRTRYGYRIDSFPDGGVFVHTNRTDSRTYIHCVERRDWTIRKAFLSIPRNERHNAFPPYLIAERLAVRLLCPRNSPPKDWTRKSKWFGVSFSTLGSPRPKQNTAHLRFCRENRTVRMRRFRYYRVSLFRHMPETVAALGRRTARTYMNP